MQRRAGETSLSARHIVKSSDKNAEERLPFIDYKIIRSTRALQEQLNFCEYVTSSITRAIDLKKKSDKIFSFIIIIMMNEWMEGIARHYRRRWKKNALVFDNVCPFPVCQGARDGRSGRAFVAADNDEDEEAFVKA